MKLPKGVDGPRMVMWSLRDKPRKISMYRKLLTIIDNLMYDYYVEWPHFKPLWIDRIERKDKDNEDRT